MEHIERDLQRIRKVKAEDLKVWKDLDWHSILDDEKEDLVK